MNFQANIIIISCARCFALYFSHDFLALGAPMDDLAFIRSFFLRLRSLCRFIALRRFFNTLDISIKGNILDSMLEPSKYGPSPHARACPTFVNESIDKGPDVNPRSPAPLMFPLKNAASACRFLKLRPSDRSRMVVDGEAMPRTLQTTVSRRRLVRSN
jgi:hypothetical protein